MSAELLQLAQELESRGYRLGSKLVESFTKSLAEEGVIPQSLRDTSSVTEDSMSRTERLLRQAREGAYLDEAKLGKLFATYETTLTDRREITYAGADIQELGHDSLYHLCLPTSIKNRLLRVGKIRSIPDLRQAVTNGRLTQIRGLGYPSQIKVRSCLSEFDRLLLARKG